MSLDTRNHLLLKIVAGSAWADGHLEPAELNYLHMLLQRYGLAEDPELRTLLDHPISLDDTEHWMIEFLAKASEDERMRLLGAIGNLLIADDTISPEERQLLDDYHTLMVNIPVQADSAPKLVSAVGKFFKKVAQVISTS